MRSKLIAVAVVALLGVGASKHLTGDQKMCPLGKMIFSGTVTAPAKALVPATEVKQVKESEKNAGLHQNK